MEAALFRDDVHRWRRSREGAGYAELGICGVSDLGVRGGVFVRIADLV